MTNITEVQLNNTPVVQMALMLPDMDTLSCIINLANTLNLNENFDTSVRISLQVDHKSELSAYMEKQHPKIKFQYDVLYKKTQAYEGDLNILVREIDDKIERFLLTNLLQLKKNINSDGHRTKNVHVWFHNGIATLFYKKGIDSISWRIMFAFQYDKKHHVPVFVDAPLRYQLEMIHVFFTIKGWSERAIAKQFGCSVDYLTDVIQKCYKSKQYAVDEYITL